MMFLIHLLLISVVTAEEKSEANATEIAATGSVAAASPEVPLPAGHAELSTEKRARASKLAKAIKKVLTLHKYLSPVAEKLSTAMATMKDGPQKVHLRELLRHIRSLDLDATQVQTLVNKLKTSKHGTHEEKAAAAKDLLTGMKVAAADIKTQMAELRALKAQHASVKAAKTFTTGFRDGRLEATMAKMKAKMMVDMADPRVKTDMNFQRKVRLEVMLFTLMKQTVEKSKALIYAASEALRKDKSEKMQNAVQLVLKQKLGELETGLKSDVKILMQAMAEKFSEEEKAEKAAGKTSGSGKDAVEPGKAAEAKAEKAEPAPEKPEAEKAPEAKAKPAAEKAEPAPEKASEDDDVDTESDDDTDEESEAEETEETEETEASKKETKEAGKSAEGGKASMVSTDSEASEAEDAEDDDEAEESEDDDDASSGKGAEKTATKPENDIEIFPKKSGKGHLTRDLPPQTD